MLPGGHGKRRARHLTRAPWGWTLYSPADVHRHLEELTLNAWPPLRTLLFDGWLLGFAGGYTRRANSVQPLYPSLLPLASKIETCAAIYASHGRAITFKVTSAPADPDLDATLERLGYALEAPTSVQTVELAAFATAPSEPAVVLHHVRTDGWLADFNRLSVTPPALHASERALLEKIVSPHCFAAVQQAGQTVAVGLAVAERGHVGLFDIVVDPQARNQGVGRRLCTALLRWGHAAEAAHTGYLAVLQSNDPARHLYARLGFHEQYTYWYRTKPQPSAITAEGSQASADEVR